jgi:uncharacterized protein YceH (UPF0502 family)
MSPTSAEAPTSLVAQEWPALSMTERRVLGVLVEKSKTTPDVYPMSINALVTGCNQKSNRDPILDLNDVEVEDALLSAQKKGLTIRVSGSGRVVRWKHAMYDAWKVGKVEAAIMTELLLRGPQTEGELRGRAGRMEPIEDLDALRALLKPLAERRLVVYLTPEGRRGTLLTHGFHASDELERLRARYAGQALDDDEPRAAPAPREAPTRPDLEPRLAAAEAEVAALKQTVAALQTDLAAARDELRALKAALGN